jgi:hypothetical protein
MAKQTKIKSAYDRASRVCSMHLLTGGQYAVVWPQGGFLHESRCTSYNAARSARARAVAELAMYYLGHDVETIKWALPLYSCGSARALLSRALKNAGLTSPAKSAK